MRISIHFHNTNHINFSIFNVINISIRIKKESPKNFANSVKLLLKEYFDIEYKKGHIIYTNREADYVISVDKSKDKIDFSLCAKDKNNESFKKAIEITEKLLKEYKGKIFLTILRDKKTSKEQEMFDIVKELSEKYKTHIFEH